MAAASWHDAAKWDAVSPWGAKRKLSQFDASEWDALSARRAFRKRHPGFDPQNGMHFPDGAPSGNRVPESRLRVGHRFRMAPSAETVSHFDFAE